MSLLTSSNDPTTALFLSEKQGHITANIVGRAYANRVKKAVVRSSYARGELEGYQVILHLNNGTPPAPLTNGDFERITDG